MSSKSKKPLVILGSSRSDGNTRIAVEKVIAGRDIEVVDLSKLDISHYDYENTNLEDDFIPLAEKMVEHDPIILATPVYWYTMSARMKVFIDRWTDLITVRKDLGRAMKGKKIFLVTSFGGEYPEGFEDPISLTCKYLDMEFRGFYPHYSGEDEEKRKESDSHLQNFIDRVWKGE